MNDLIEELSKVDLDLVEKVINHLDDDDLEERDSYKLYDITYSIKAIDLTITDIDKSSFPILSVNHHPCKSVTVLVEPT